MTGYLAETHHYEIRIRGHLDARRSGGFPDLELALTPEGDTILSGQQIDQSALFGLLLRIRDMGIPLLSVICIDAGCQPAQEGMKR